MSEGRSYTAAQARQLAKTRLAAQDEESAAVAYINAILWEDHVVELELIDELCSEIGLRFARRADPVVGSEPRSDPADYLFALRQLDRRARLTVGEIAVALRASQPNAALGRWRTLFEMYVLATFLSQQAGPGERLGAAPGELTSAVGARFYADLDREVLRLMRAHPEIHESPPDVAAQQRHVDAAVAKYGKELGRPYGWALPYLGAQPKKQVTFRDVVEACSSLHAGLKGWYAIACSGAVHGGAFNLINDPVRENAPHSVPHHSAFTLARPLQLTAQVRIAFAEVIAAELEADHAVRSLLENAQAMTEQLIDDCEATMENAASKLDAAFEKERRRRHAAAARVGSLRRKSTKRKRRG